MNDFFLLNNESLPHVFIGQNIEIKQIQVKNLNQFAYFADPIKQLESYSVETIKPVILTSIIQIMGLCSLLVGFGVLPKILKACFYALCLFRCFG